MRLFAKCLLAATLNIMALHPSVLAIEPGAPRAGAGSTPTAEEVVAMSPAHPHATHPRLRDRFAVGSLFSRFYVVRLAFSPDGRHLAIGDAGSANIVIWDLKSNREQARFKVAHLDDARRGGAGHMHWYPQEDLVWSPDGRFVTTGVGRAEKPEPLPIEFWDPDTGTRAHALDAYSAHSALFNHDGGKLLNIAVDSKFSIFDTHTWLNDHPLGSDLWFDTGYPITQGYAWSSDDKVLMVGIWAGPLKNNRALPRFEAGQTPPHFSMLVQKLDPTGREPVQIGVLAGPVRTDDPKRPFAPPFVCLHMVASREGHRAAVQCGLSVLVVDTLALKTLFIHEEPKDSLIGDGSLGIAFSPDGKYLYMLAHDPRDRDVRSLILDATSGATVGTFPSAESWGLAISPDGSTLALGHRDHVELFDLQ